MKTTTINHETNEVLNTVPFQTKPIRETYQGWKNYQTWNVALWINNDEGLYMSAVEYLSKSKRPTYMGFIRWSGLEDTNTPDGIKFNGTRLDYKALNKMMLEFMN